MIRQHCLSKATLPLYHHVGRAFRMASSQSCQHTRPVEPLLVILGSTGTGKSELAVELATRFRGEIINADAMQLYKGLPIITNKITEPERRGIPHHLLDHIDLDDTPWIVDDFKREATKTIQAIRDRGNLPIVVGGTHYYTNSLLFRDIFVDGERAVSPDILTKNVADEADGASFETQFPILNESTEVILARLREVDPEMADRWHPNDRRKISRSLTIYLQYGRPASEIYAEQKQRKAASRPHQPSSSSSWETLLFWVHSGPEVLKERLDKRVDKMVDAGLMDETAEMFEHIKKVEANGGEVDFTKGIWQSIGFKELMPYVRASHAKDTSARASERGSQDPELEQLRASGLESMKIATRQYAKYQTRWIRTKIMPLLREQPGNHGSENGVLDSLFVLDSSDVSQWTVSVAEPAALVTQKFLTGEGMPRPASLSAAAAGVLEEAAASQVQRTMRRRTCEICQVTCVTEEEWKAHVGGRKHRNVLKRKKKTALMAIEDVGSCENPGKSVPDTSADVSCANDPTSSN